MKAEMRMWKLIIYTTNLEKYSCQMQQHYSIVANKYLCEHLQWAGPATYSLVYWLSFLLFPVLCHFTLPFSFSNSFYLFFFFLILSSIFSAAFFSIKSLFSAFFFFNILFPHMDLLFFCAKKSSKNIVNIHYSFTNTCFLRNTNCVSRVCGQSVYELRTLNRKLKWLLVPLFLLWQLDIWDEKLPESFNIWLSL